MYKFEFNVQLDGLGTTNIPKTIDSVSFNNISGKLYATTIIKSRYKTKIAKYKLLDAVNLLNEAILRIMFIYKVKITLSEKGYLIKRLFQHKTPYITCSTFTFKYSINTDYDELSNKIALLEPTMIPILNKALAYYQSALESDNLYVRTILLVSCVSSIIKDQYKIKRDLCQKDLIYYLDEVRKKKQMRTIVLNFINYVYGKIRSKPAHGNVDIKDKMNISEISSTYKKFQEIVDLFIEEFLDNNKRMTNK